MTVEVWFELFIPPATAFYCRNQVDTLVVLYRFCHANQIAFFIRRLDEAIILFGWDMGNDLGGNETQPDCFLISFAHLCWAYDVRKALIAAASIYGKRHGLIDRRPYCGEEDSLLRA